MTKLGDSVTIQVFGKGDVAVQEPEVLNLSEKLRLLPTTLVGKINEALSTVVERRLYLIVAEGMIGAGSIIGPKTFGRIVDSFTGSSRNLDNTSLVVHEAGENLVISEIDQFADFLGTVLELRGEFGLDLESACKLTHIYHDNAVDIVTSIAENIDWILEEIRIRNEKEGAKLQRAVKYVVEVLLGRFQRAGRPMPSTVSEMFDPISEGLGMMPGYREDQEGAEGLEGDVFDFDGKDWKRP